MGEQPPAQPKLTPQFCLSTTTLRGALARLPRGSGSALLLTCALACRFPEAIPEYSR